MLKVSDILSGSMSKYLETHKLSFKQRKVVNKIINCFSDNSPELLFECSNSSCDYTELRKKPCRDRHCNRCNVSKKLKWLLKVIKEYLPLPYYHIVFTLPSELNNLSICNQKMIYDIFFQSSFYVLNKFGADKRYFGGKIGFIGLLHTWGQKLNYHPHIHFIVLAGGIKEGKYKGLPYEKDFIFPVKAMSRVMMGKFIELLKQRYIEGIVKFPGKLDSIKSNQSFNGYLKKLSQKEWVVYSKKPLPGSEKVLEYISRYAYKVAISNSRLKNYKDEEVSFEYRDYYDKDNNGIAKKKILKLSGMEFIRRYLLHILPEGYRKLRYGGIFSSNQKRESLRIIKESLESIIEEILKKSSLWIAELEEGSKSLCPSCMGNLLPKKTIMLSGYI